MTSGMDIELLRCFKCEGYLSDAPISILHGGSSLCSRCSPAYDEKDITRLLVLEQIVSKVSFPCRFQSHGCKEMLLFDTASSHEVQCSHRLIKCPLTALNKCNWEGSLAQIIEHLSQEHPKQLLKSNKFKLQINDNKKGLLMLSKNSVPFFIAYIYNAVMSAFYCSIKYYKLPIIDEAFCNIKLANDSIQFKGCSCSSYNNDVLDFEAKTVINLTNYKRTLNNPECVVFTFDLHVSKTVALTQTAINYGLLTKMQCCECRSFFTPPIFDSKKGIICIDCSNDTSINCKNEKASDLMLKTTVSCCWNDCHFIGNCNTIRNHESLCQFRHYKCLVCKFNKRCKEPWKDTFNRLELIQHLHVYNFKHFDEKYIYKTMFYGISIRSTSTNYEYTIQNDEFIAVERCDSNYLLSFRAWTSSCDSNKFVIGVTLEHAHCVGRKLNFFPNLEQLEIRLHDLPACFAEREQIDVTVRVHIAA